jgi:excisionase family DNA binding protein
MTRDVFTVQQAADYLGISHKTIRGWVRSGRVKSKHVLAGEIGLPKVGSEKKVLAISREEIETLAPRLMPPPPSGKVAKDELMTIRDACEYLSLSESFIRRSIRQGILKAEFVTASEFGDKKASAVPSYRMVSAISRAECDRFRPYAEMVKERLKKGANIGPY